MISYEKTKAMYRCAFLLATAISIVACTKNDEVDYCKNHYAFHMDHLDTLATLTIIVSESGGLNGDLSIPDSNFGEDTYADIRLLLEDPANIFTLQTEIPCAVAATVVSSSGDGLETTLVANCGSDNKLGQISVALFDHMAALEEIVVSVTTPATAKRFGISRQCAAPIFRLD